jgi:hypothetical protein
MKNDQNKNSRTDALRPIGKIEAVPTRVQSPRDAYGYKGGTFTPGKAPHGGFQPVWNFGTPSPGDSKNSPTGKPEKRG